MGISGRLNWSDPRLLIILLDSGKGSIGPHRVESNRFQVPSYGSTVRRLYGSPRGKTSQTPSKKPGTFSKRSLDFLSTLEKSEAHLFTALCGFILDVQGEPILAVLNWGESIYVDAGITYDSLSHLNAIDLVQFSPRLEQ
jgi:Protein of unknown function (DUF2806)